MNIARLPGLWIVCGLLWGWPLAAAVPPGEERASQARAAGILLPAPAPDKRAAESGGPYERLVIANVMLIDGLGSPPRGPVTLTIEQDKITGIAAYRPHTPEAVADTASARGRYIDGQGMTALPGFVDSHVHIGNPMQGLAGPVTPPEYVFKLWLAHGITTVRDVGSIMGLEWTVGHARRSERNEIVAPRIIPYAMFPGSKVVTANDAKTWVRSVAKRGAAGVKFRGGTFEALESAYSTARELGLGTASHHDQNGVYDLNALDSARLGLDSVEHWYGLPEALFVDRQIQAYPADYNYSDEQWRFSEAGRLWLQAAEPGSERWNAVLAEMVALDLTLVPTFTIYEANRDVPRARDAEWHARYTYPSLAAFFLPDARFHGSYHFDWTTGDEVAWRNNFRRWMQFVNEFKNLGGRVATGSDAGFIFKLYGFAFIREMELLQEAGFHPLEVLQAATRNGAELVGKNDEFGSLTVGRKADLVLVGENPLANFKVLYGTGHMRLNRGENVLKRVGGVSYTIKDGVVFDAKALLADVEQMVSAARTTAPTE